MPYYYSPFRKEYDKVNRPENRSSRPCVFCNQEKMSQDMLRNHHNIPVENEHYFWIVNWYPRAEAHTMLIPKRHIINIQDETDEEVLARNLLLKQITTILQNTFSDTGIEVFFQTGKGSLSSVEHLHWHIIPTLPQHSLPGLEKFGYFYTTEPDTKKIITTPVDIKIARKGLMKLISKTCKKMDE